MVALSQASNAFVAWAASQGITSPLDLEERAGGRYVTCRQDVTAGDDLLQIPLSSCITADNLESLAERLAYERELGSKSKFTAYINVLPTLESKSLLELPRFWKGSRLDLVTDGGQLEARMSKDERKDLDQWALACVDSRANFLGDKGYSMTPMLDMINHDASVQTRARIEEDKGFAGDGDVLHLTSGKSYSKGEEAFISYGNLANLDTLADYGFVTEKNPCNVESIEVRVVRRPPFAITVYADGSIDAGSKATLRYYLANEEELEIFSTLEDGQGIGILAKPISDRNELDVTSFIASTIAEAADDASMGAADSKDDQLINMYLKERARQLDLAIRGIKRKYPDLEY
jgi:hypothetical protein|mmetsp:Transcript_16744/g.36309  ORF Transcript_16744/g.36309 Transcript_16744/m.36309 type:complete len:347 (-) Transcript_16744:473-1513(-)